MDAVLLTKHDMKLFLAYLIEDGKGILANDDAMRASGSETLAASVRQGVEEGLSSLVEEWGQSYPGEDSLAFVTEHYAEVDPLLAKMDVLVRAGSVISTRHSLN